MILKTRIIGSNRFVFRLIGWISRFLFRRQGSAPWRFYAFFRQGDSKCAFSEDSILRHHQISLSSTNSIMSFGIQFSALQNLPTVSIVIFSFSFFLKWHGCWYPQPIQGLSFSYSRRSTNSGAFYSLYPYLRPRFKQDLLRKQEQPVLAVKNIIAYFLQKRNVLKSDGYIFLHFL